jgi:hypothetical protein
LVTIDVIEIAINGVLGSDESVKIAYEVVVGSVDNVIVEYWGWGCWGDASWSGRRGWYDTRLG